LGANQPYFEADSILVKKKSHLIEMAAARYRSPRRESIEDHLATARARYPELAGDDSSRPWVRDLIRDGLIDAPHPVKKRSGRGQGMRFWSRDYRALIEILLLRSRGHGHRRTWLIWLWLRGREYPIAKVREAIVADASSHLKMLRAQLNPTGRSTEPFVTKYRRNIAPQRADSPFPDLGSLEEPLAAWMMRPGEAAQMTIDLDDLSTLLARALEVDTQTMSEALQDLNASSPQNAQDSMLKFAEVIPQGPFRTLMEEFARFDPSDLPKPPQLAGIIDDGRGNSTLLAALSAASDQQFINARREVQAIRTGRFESALRAAAADALPRDADVLLFFADYMRMQRELYRGNPALAAYLFALHVQADGEPVPIPAGSSVDVNALLRALRDQ